MSLQTVFICAPYRAPDRAGIEKNIERAIALGALAIREGLAPYIPHLHERAHILAGTTPDEPDETALHAGLQMAILMRGEAMWVLLRDDGTRSSGCHDEVETHGDAREAFGMDRSDDRLVELTWLGWGPVFDMEGLGDLWRSLR